MFLNPTYADKWCDDILLAQRVGLDPFSPVDKMVIVIFSRLRLLEQVRTFYIAQLLTPILHEEVDFRFISDNFKAKYQPKFTIDA